MSEAIECGFKSQRFVLDRIGSIRKVLDEAGFASEEQETVAIIGLDGSLSVFSLKDFFNHSDLSCQEIHSCVFNGIVRCDGENFILGIRFYPSVDGLVISMDFPRGSGLKKLEAYFAFCRRIARFSGAETALIGREMIDGDDLATFNAQAFVELNDLSRSESVGYFHSIA